MSVRISGTISLTMIRNFTSALYFIGPACDSSLSLGLRPQGILVPLLEYLDLHRGDWSHHGEWPCHTIGRIVWCAPCRAALNCRMHF